MRKAKKTIRGTFIPILKLMSEREKDAEINRLQRKCAQLEKECNKWVDRVCREIKTRRELEKAVAGKESIIRQMQ